MRNKIIIQTDNKQTKSVTLEEAKNVAKTFSPIKNWQGNTHYKATSQIRKKINKTTDLDLETLIEFLKNIHDKFGNIPVLYFNGKTETFTKFNLFDIDVVKQHFTLSGNIKDTTMHIKKEKALTLTHC